MTDFEQFKPKPAEVVEDGSAANPFRTSEGLDREVARLIQEIDDRFANENTGWTRADYESRIAAVHDWERRGRIALGL